jgi:hypothetical protein
MTDHISRVSSERKARLLGVACCRHVYGGTFDQRALTAVEVAEQFADDVSELDALAESHAATAEGRRFWELGPEYRLTAPPPASSLIIVTCGALGRFRDERTAICDLIRDIFGNPFRSVALNPEWRTDTAVSLARHFYESRDFSAMPILADALQDAGCNNDDILDHCRDPKGIHVRGCWVVDLVLGKA